MTASTRDSIYEAIASIRLIDPHTHINPHSPASTTLADLLGYHYYTELAHSAGMPKSKIEEPGLAPRELVHRLVKNLSPLENTAQYRWLVEICRMFFGFDGHRIDESNWEELYEQSESAMASADWSQVVLDQSNVESVFLTNDFDDELSGFDTDTYIPCLRTDDLVFHLSKSSVRERLAAASGIELSDSLTSLRESLRQRFQYFISRGARACAISLPPDFCPSSVSDGRASSALSHVLQNGELADASHKAALSRRVFWTLAELCDEFGLPFDLMIGVNRGVYAGGVYQGQDLYDSRVSLTQYRELFNAFPGVKFPVSVLASVTNQELVSHAWIFPNVITNGHWWYSNTPSFITRDAKARLEAVPCTKQIGYYSDAYKLEFVWPKFDMYRRCLAGILHDHFVVDCGWTEESAIDLGRQILRTNVDEIFPRPTSQVSPEDDSSASSSLETVRMDEDDPNATLAGIASIGATASLAAGAIGLVEVDPESPAEELSHFDINQTLPMETSSVDLDIAETIEIDQADPSQDALGLPERADEIPFKREGSELPEMDSLVEETLMVESETEASPNQQDVDDEIDMDPVPTVDEVESLGVGDVELSELSGELSSELSSEPTTGEGGERIGGDADSLETLLDDEPLDVGDLYNDAEPLSATTPDNFATIEISKYDDDDSKSPTIEPLRNEDSFAPDEDSLLLKPDPLTGELTFPSKDEGEDELDLSLPSGASTEETISFEEAIDITSDDEDLLIDFGEVDEDENAK